MVDLHIEGGILFMAPLTLLLLGNLGLIAFVLFSKIQNKQFWIETIRQIGLLALVWGAFSTMVGLYQAFGDLSNMTEQLPFTVIMGGLKVALITALYGLVIFIISLIGFMGLKMISKNSPVNG